MTDLDVAYAAADVLVLASRAETYGMVVTEALARRGLPVSRRPSAGCLRPSVAGPMGAGPACWCRPATRRRAPLALRRWLSDTDLRRRLDRPPGSAALTLSGWSATSVQISRVLAEVNA